MSVDGSSLGWSTEQNNGMAIVTRQTMERQTATIVCLAFQMRLRPSPCLLEDATALQLQPLQGSVPNRCSPLDRGMLLVARMPAP